MLFHEAPGAQPLAISQPAHAWISGQLLRAWADPLGQTLLLAAEQHDIGWLDWETAPSFDSKTGRPHSFRAVGAAIHAPMWAQGVDRALNAWGRHVALLISRHGTLIYTSYVDRHRSAPADAAAAEHYLATQATLQAAWARSLGLAPPALAHDAAMLALSDTISLALCGDLPTPLDIIAPRNQCPLRLAAKPGQANAFTLTPWPLRTGALTVECEARPMPDAPFPDEHAMRVWLAHPARAAFNALLTPN